MEIKLKKKNQPKEEGFYLCKEPLFSTPEFVEVGTRNEQLTYISRLGHYAIKDCRKDCLWSDKLTIVECY